ncbi:MAG: hypothetical protein JNG88_13965 [Phycisphaerales bacterium]|nr:hypothetical protein [Phycisphaerales bacterium]
MSSSPFDRRPAFLITMDTEGDNIWSAPREITTRNARFLPRFQTLCEKYKLKPTWLTNWEMVQCPVDCEFAADALRRGQCEIGMHLHAWNNPPIEPLTDDDYHYLPYLIEYPQRLIREKVRVVTNAVSELFGRPMRSHRAGRWGFNSVYARTLAEAGYVVDCSVTPHTSWRNSPGNPAGSGGPDFRGYPEHAYFMDLDVPRRAGTSRLLQLPVTILPSRMPRAMEPLRDALSKSRLARGAFKVVFGTTRWLRPDSHNRATLLSVLRDCMAQGRDYVEFMLHSSELMPGGSPHLADEASIERLYEDMEALFEAAAQRCVGLTLDEYHARFTSAAAPRA